jgi:hypothetical protein
MVTYIDADWAGCPNTRCSISGFCVYLDDNLISWSSKRQHTVSRSSTEAEYCAVANAVAEATWIRQLLHELHRPSPPATVVFCDNVSTVYMSTNPVQHQRTKHIEIDLHFVRDHVCHGPGSCVACSPRLDSSPTSLRRVFHHCCFISLTVPSRVAPWPLPLP